MPLRIRKYQHPQRSRFVETLETRALLDAAGNSLNVVGTSGDDQISLHVAGGIVTATVNGVPISELDALVSQVSISGGDGNDSIFLERNTDNSILVIAGDGDDSIILGDNAGSLSALGNVSMQILVEAGSGNDTVELNDDARSEAARYTMSGAISPPQMFFQATDSNNAPLAPSLMALNMERAVLRGGTGDDVVTVSSGSPAVALYIDAGSGDDAINISGDGGPDRAVTIVGNAGLDDLSVAAPFAVPTIVEAIGSQDWDVLQVQGNGRLRLGQSASDVQQFKQLSVSGNGTIDIGRGTLIYDYTGGSPLQTVADLIKNGYASGSWDGNGIVSSNAGSGTAVGYTESSTLFGPFPATFAGVNIDSSTVLIRYTLSGDATVDRTVGIADFARTAAAFNTSTLWVDGDFNYDRMTNIGDFSLLAANYNKTLVTAPPRVALAALRKDPIRVVDTLL